MTTKIELDVQSEKDRAEQVALYLYPNQKIILKTTAKHLGINQSQLLRLIIDNLGTGKILLEEVKASKVALWK